jgi:hypothetical protein
LLNAGQKSVDFSQIFLEIHRLAAHNRLVGFARILAEISP